VFPKSVTPSRMKENVEIFDFELGSEDMDEITALDRGEDGRTRTRSTMSPPDPPRSRSGHPKGRATGTDPSRVRSLGRLAPGIGELEAKEPATTDSALVKRFYSGLREC
jgi:hypothetical protein